MPIDLSIVDKLEEEEREIKLHPKASKKSKKKLTVSLTHYVLLDVNGKQWGDLYKTKEELEQCIQDFPDIEGPIRIQKLMCFPTITCHCGEISTFLKYIGHDIKYVCKNKHLTVISEYD